MIFCINKEFSEHIYFQPHTSLKLSQHNFLEESENELMTQHDHFMIKNLKVSMLIQEITLLT
jgi:hypothetical protein